MNTNFTFKATLLAAALFSLAPALAANLSKADYDAGKTRIGAAYKSDAQACASRSANAKDVCIEQAKAKEKVELAQLEYNYSGTPADQTKLMVIKAEAAHAVAKEQCDEKAGNAKDVCVKEAKAVETKALADARMGKQIGEAEKEAGEDKRNADYSVASEKCETLAGDAKTECSAAAKAKFGKR